jgi:predicted Fe-Mo cluster-binding NifX family protein
MKVAICALSGDIGGGVDARFGRAAFFAVYDTDASSWQVLQNRAGTDSEQGAGIQAALLLAQHGVTALVTGHCGPKAYIALSTGGITVSLTDCTDVKAALAAYLCGSLRLLTAPDVQSHW